MSAKEGMFLELVEQFPKTKQFLKVAGVEGVRFRGLPRLGILGPRVSLDSAMPRRSFSQA